jgi:hypothetical protein
VVSIKGVFILATLFFARSAFAQSTEKEPAAVVELGGAASGNITQAESSFGPAAAVEVTPIENWLELEAGVTPLFGPNSKEWDIDLLFKKPWTLSKKTEFMIGVGPEWIRSTKNNITTNSVAGEFALDFMLWRSEKHRFGWYVEPAYEYNFVRPREQSIGITGGILIAIP